MHCANGMSGEAFHVFVATDLTPGQPNREISEQDMRQRWFSRTDVKQMLRDGVITDSPTAAAYLLLTLHE